DYFCFVYLKGLRLFSFPRHHSLLVIISKIKRYFLFCDCVNVFHPGASDIYRLFVSLNACNPLSVILGPSNSNLPLLLPVYLNTSPVVSFFNSYGPLIPSTVIFKSISNGCTSTLPAL